MSPQLLAGHSPARRATAAFAASALAFAGALALLGPATGTASSHREAPLIANDPQADNTDLYAFVSPDRPGYVTLVSNWQPFAEPAGGPNFYPFPTDARFNIYVDNDGDARPDITYRWTFRTRDLRGLDTFLYNNGPVTFLTDPNLLFRQSYRLVRINENGGETVLVDNGKVVPSRVGDASMPNYGRLREAAISRVPGGGRSFVGQADDPFFLDLRVFDLIYGEDLSETGSDTLTGYNVNTVALQVPIASVTAKGDPVIGVWTTTERRSMRVLNRDGSQDSSGPWVQVSRLGNPLVNEVVIPAGLKDAFNALEPKNDADVPAAVDRVLDPELPKVIEAIYGIEAPETPRNDLFAIFLTGLKGLNRPANPDLRPAEMLRLNTSIEPTTKPNRLGVLGGDPAGYPNGRRLADDVVDIAIQAVEGAVTVDENGMATGVDIVEPLAAGDRVDTNDVRFGRTFPYVALPHSGSDPRPGTSGEDTAGWPATSGSAGTTGSGTTGSAMPDESSWPYAAGLAGIGLVALGAGVALRGRRLRLQRPALARMHG